MAVTGYSYTMQLSKPSNPKETTMATTQKTFRQIITTMLAGQRALDKLAAQGITIRQHRNLDKMTNQQWVGGRLNDALCHYSRRWEVAGQTYAIRELLRAWGFAWDPARKCWWLPVDRTDGHTIARRLRKVMAKRGLAA